MRHAIGVAAALAECNGGALSVMDGGGGGGDSAAAIDLASAGGGDLASTSGDLAAPLDGEPATFPDVE